MKTRKAPLPDVRQEQFDAFVAEHQDKAVRMARRLVGGDLAAAEDVAQEAFIRAIDRADSFATGRRVVPWLIAILTNEARTLRWHRRKTAAAPARPALRIIRWIEPPVSSPTPRVARLAAMAAPVPLLEPPGSRSRS